MSFFNNIDYGYVKTVLIVLVIIVAMRWFLTYNDTELEEDFITYIYPKYCNNCGELGKYACNNCKNCGYCYTPNGYGECVPGDANGPYFREDCLLYNYNNPGYNIKRHYPYIYHQNYPYLKIYPKISNRRNIKRKLRRKIIHKPKVKI